MLRRRAAEIYKFNLLLRQQKRNKAKNKIVTQYLEQTKLDHEAEVQGLNAQIKEL